MRTGDRTGLKKKGKKGIGSKSLEKKKLECYIYILKKKLYKTRVPRSIPQVFIKIFFVPISHNYYI